MTLDELKAVTEDTVLFTCSLDGLSDGADLPKNRDEALAWGHPAIVCRADPDNALVLVEACVGRQAGDGWTQYLAHAVPIEGREHARGIGRTREEAVRSELDDDITYYRRELALAEQFLAVLDGNQPPAPQAKRRQTT